MHLLKIKPIRSRMTVPATATTIKSIVYSVPIDVQQDVEQAPCFCWGPGGFIPGGAVVPCKPAPQLGQNSQCYRWTKEDNKRKRRGESRAEICQSHGYTYTKGKNANFPNCGRCHCCKTGLPVDRIINVEKNTLVKTLDQWGPDFNITQELPKDEWLNFIHLTTGLNCCNAGSRLPGVWFRRTSDVIHMVVAMAFNKYKQHTVEYIKPTLQSMKWYSVEMEQRKVSETAATFTVKVNNEKAWVLDTEPLQFSQVKLYMSDPWYKSLEGLALVKNLVIDGEPINVLQFTGGERYVGSSAAETNIVPHEVGASSQESTVTCGNGQIIDLRDEFDDEYHWFSPGYNNNEEYPENTECKATFRIPPRQNFEIKDISNFDVYGDYANGCENGDYVQFTVNGKKSKKFCGEGSELSNAWCWEDWCWPYTFEVLGNPNEDLLVEAVFKTGKKHRGWNYGFEIVLSPGSPWDSEKPEPNLDDIPMLPMLAE